MLREQVRGPSLSVALLGCLLLCPAVDAGTFPATKPSDVTAIKNRVWAAQFLARATYGYTEVQLEDLARRIGLMGQQRALSQWIDEQAALPPTLHEPMALQMLTDDGYTTPYQDPIPTGALSRNSYREATWWNVALTAPDQLRQRMAWSLMQIVVINQSIGVFGENSTDAGQIPRPRYMGIVDYYDMLVGHALGNYRAVLGDVTYHPVMGNFLTHLNNKKPNLVTNKFPDENYAREIMQLMTIGENHLFINGVLKKTPAGELMPVYNNDDIRALARVFTGLRYATAAGLPTGTVNLHDPMAMQPNDHDFTAKVFPTLGLTLPARSASVANANAEINAAVDFLFNHPNVGPFIARLLIQRLVRSNPSKSYIKRVAQVFEDNGQGVRGDLRAVAKAILLDTEALNSHKFVLVRDVNGRLSGVRVETGGTEDSRLQEPVILYSQFIKLFQGQPITTFNGFRITVNFADTNQLPYQAPSVFNFYPPDYQPPGFENHVASAKIPNGKLYAPEFQIFTSVVANRFPNLFYRHLRSNIANTNRINMTNSFTLETQLAQTDPASLLRRLDLLMCHGTMSDQSQSTIISAMTNSTNQAERARAAILAVVTSPEYSIDE